MCSVCAVCSVWLFCFLDNVLIEVCTVYSRYMLRMRAEMLVVLALAQDSLYLQGTLLLIRDGLEQLVQQQQQQQSYLCATTGTIYTLVHQHDLRVAYRT